MNASPLTTQSGLGQIRPFSAWSTLRYWLVWAYDGPVPSSAHEGHFDSGGQPEFSCWLVRRGEATIRANGQSVHAKPGQWVFVATGRRYQSFSADIEILSLHVHLSWPGNEPVIRQRHSYVLDAEEHPELERLARPLVGSVKAGFPKTITDLYRSDCSLLSYIEIQNKLPEWLVAYLRIQSAHGIEPLWMNLEDSRVLQALMELDRQPLNRPFSEKALVRQIGLSQSRLNTLFVQATGMTPKRYFEKRRFDAAKHMLENTRMSMKETALNLGFRYDSHFTQWFRTQADCPPSQYRNQFHNSNLH